MSRYSQIRGTILDQVKTILEDPENSLENTPDGTPGKITWKMLSHAYNQVNKQTSGTFITTNTLHSSLLGFSSVNKNTQHDPFDPIAFSSVIDDAIERYGRFIQSFEPKVISDLRALKKTIESMLKKYRASLEILRQEHEVEIKQSTTIANTNAQISDDEVNNENDSALSAKIKAANANITRELGNIESALVETEKAETAQIIAIYSKQAKAAADVIQENIGKLNKNYSKIVAKDKKDGIKNLVKTARENVKKALSQAEKIKDREQSKKTQEQIDSQVAKINSELVVRNQTIEKQTETIKKMTQWLQIAIADPDSIKALKEKLQEELPMLEWPAETSEKNPPISVVVSNSTILQSDLDDLVKRAYFYSYENGKENTNTALTAYSELAKVLLVTAKSCKDQNEKDHYGYLLAMLSVNKYGDLEKIFKDAMECFENNNIILNQEVVDKLKAYKNHDYKQNGKLLCGEELKIMSLPFRKNDVKVENIFGDSHPGKKLFTDINGKQKANQLTADSYAQMVSNFSENYISSRVSTAPKKVM